jgi:cardiolipin synthase A/B
VRSAVARGALCLALAGCATAASGPAPEAGSSRAGSPLPFEADAPANTELLARQAAGAQELYSTPVSRGNEVRLLIDGPKTYQAMFGAMERARDHINLETYILEEGEAGERLAELLAKKVAQGVKVQVLYDSVGSVGTPKEYFQRLKSAGVALCEFNPVNPVKKTLGWNLNKRNHRKILVVDGQVAFTGGINISKAYSAGSSSLRRPAEVEKAKEEPHGWRDTQVQAEGPVVARFQQLFLDDWSRQQCGPSAPARYYPKPEPRGSKAARVVDNDPDKEKSEMYAALLAAIGQARQRVWLTVGYFVPDPRTRQALIDAARRGVDVRLVLPGFSDFWAPVYAARSNYEDLLAAGVRIYEWHKALMHAKTAVIDSGWSSIGSTNVDWRSFVHNYEADLVVYDAAFAREMERRFRIDVQEGVAIDPEEFRRRGTRERIKEWFARQWEYLL